MQYRSIQPSEIAAQSGVIIPYVFVFDEEGNSIAHINPAVLGENLKGDLGADSTGYRFGDSMLAAIERGHWVNYVLENPVTGN